ncbi:EAL domain-containing protein [Alteromonas halophila]|nr:GGDEF domain-containing phosphodiesterase [Alteromonas halophila]
MQISLRHSLFRLLLGGIVITAMLILFAVWNGTNDLIQKNVERELLISRGILQRVITDRYDGLGTASSAISNTFEFRQQVGLRSIPDLNSTLESFARRLDAQQLLVMDLQHKIITSLPERLAQGQVTPFKALNRKIDYDTVVGDFIVLDNTLYYMVVTPVKAPRTIAYLGVGFQFSRAFLSNLSDVVGAEIIVHLNEAQGEQRILSASVDSQRASALLAESGQEPSWFDITLDTEGHYLTRSFSLPELGELPVEFSLALDVGPQFRSFTNLQLTIIFIALVAMLVALAVAMLLSKRVSGPVASLVEAVNNIANGDYEQPLKPKGRLSEIADLAKAFTSMQQRIRSREERIRYQAQHDMLTGLYNRDYVDQRLEARLGAGETLQIVGINISGFRTINDLYGYSNGDTCLKIVAERLLRWPGMAARLSGGEVLFVPDQALTELQLETLRYILEQPVETNALSIPVRVTISVINCPESGHSAQEIFRKINIVADENERSGKWLVWYHEEMEQHYLRRLTIITELKKALMSEHTELSMVYQPKINLETSQICSVEALIRWNNKALGFVPPDEFIGIAEQAGLIELVTSWVIERTLIDLASFREAGYSFTVAMNLSTQDIQHPELLGRLNSVIRREGLLPEDLELEITESDLVEDAATATDNLTKLSNLGYRFAIDDFGTGYSSLAYLKTLPVNTIKIDKSFVLNLATDRSDQQIVRTVLNLAKVFGLEVVAEGVEDETSLNVLKKWGCNIAQGYFISKPVTTEGLFEWLANSPYSIKNKEDL